MRGPQAFSKGDQMNVLAYGLIITVLGGHPTIAKFIYVLVFFRMIYLIYSSLTSLDESSTILRIVIAILLLGATIPWMVASCIAFVWFIFVVFFSH